MKEPATAARVAAAIIRDKLRTVPRSPRPKALHLSAEPVRWSSLYRTSRTTWMAGRSPPTQQLDCHADLKPTPYPIGGQRYGSQAPGERNADPIP
jgi:hypothetical protein